MPTFDYTSRLTDRVAPVVEIAVRAHGMGEDILFDVMLMPNSQGSVGLVLALWLPDTLTIGNRLNGIVQVPDPVGMSEMAWDDLVSSALAQMRTQRAERTVVAKAQSNGQGDKLRLLPGQDGS